MVLKSYERVSLKKSLLACALAAACATLQAQQAPAAPSAPKARASVEAAGATFPSKIYAQWAKAFEQEAGFSVSYTPTGSGDGIKQIKANSVHFGGSDSPLPIEELRKYNLVQVPMLVGGVVPVVNLPGIADKRLQLTGEVLGAIMAGTIAHWNDPAITELNPGVKLPALPIHRIVRLDKSGTTDGFTRYLAGASEVFKKDVGISQKPKWPGHVQEADGNDGVSSALQTRPGSITYVSFDRAQKENMTTVRLRNASGKFVAASEDGFRSAMEQSDITKRDNDMGTLMDQPGAQTWPITLASFVLVPAAPEKSEDASKTLKFLYWCFLHGDRRIRGTGFSPLPVSLQARAVSRFLAIKAKDNKPLQYVVLNDPKVTDLPLAKLSLAKP